MTAADKMTIEALRFRNDRTTGFRPVRQTDAQIAELLTQRAKTRLDEALADGGVTARDERAIESDLALAAALTEGSSND